MAIATQQPQSCGQDMPAGELRIENRTTYFRKALKSPDFGSDSVLTRDPFGFVELWLKRNCKEALPFWTQAKNYFSASRNLPAESAPLTLYYCYLNAAKALLTVKKIPFTPRHGVSGTYDPTSRRSLSKETVKIERSGVMADLSSYLEEPEKNNEHLLIDLLANLAYIHRTFRYTYKSRKEMFIPIENPLYRQHPTDGYVWFSAGIEGRFADTRSLTTLPPIFEVDEGFPRKNNSCTVRTKYRIKWHKTRGATAAEKETARKKLWGVHRKTRLAVQCISAPIDIWYIKRCVAGCTYIERYNITIAMAIMHRLSELSRYDPKGLIRYLEGKENWLLTEFIQLSPAQFIDELACEMTSLEIRLPGVRS